MGVDEALEEYKRVAGGLASRLEKKCAGPSVIEAEMLAGVTTSLHAPVVSDGPEAFRQARITISIMMVMGSDDDHDHACVAMEKLEMLEALILARQEIGDGNRLADMMDSAIAKATGGGQ